MNPFRKRPQMLSLYTRSQLNTPVCEPRWHVYDQPACSRARPKVERRKAVREAV